MGCGRTVTRSSRAGSGPGCEIDRVPDRKTCCRCSVNCGTQRLAPLAKALAATTDGQPTVRRLIVLPSRVMAGIPIEAILAPDDIMTVSYAPSATVFKYLLRTAPT